MLSHNAFWSSAVTSGGLTLILLYPSLSASSSVRKRWWGATSHVTFIPFSLAARITKIWHKKHVYREHHLVREGNQRALRPDSQICWTRWKRVHNAVYADRPTPKTPRSCYAVIRELNGRRWRESEGRKEQRKGREEKWKGITREREGEKSYVSVGRNRK